MFFRLIFLLGVILAGTSRLEAQQQHPRRIPSRHNKQAPMQQMERFEADGTLKQKMPSGFLLVTKNQQEWWIAVGPKTKITYTAEARPEFLRPGICVAFKAPVDHQGKTAEKIKQLSVFTPSREKMPGIFPEGQAPQKEPLRKTDKKSQEPVTCEVCGKLVNYDPRSRRFQVNALRGNVRGELDEKVKIAVELSNALFAAEGDRVAVIGLMAPAAPGRALANRLKIEAARVLGEEEKKHPPRPADRRQSPRDPKSPKAAQEKGLPVPRFDR
ncbi:MAG: hypothetical protein JXB10_12740 [Pirellulales bacterium]|nr:hypothetical protein [Pirellulales bacterium]